MINVFTPLLTSRIEYAFNLIFRTILKCNVKLYTLPEDFQKAKGIKINYSTNNNIEGLKLEPYGLLNETHLVVQKLDLIEWDEEKAFFSVNNSFIPFDVFSAAFYLVSRYEEYLPSKRDSHYRFMSKNSLAAEKHFLELPLVNMWAWKLAKILENEYKEITIAPTKFTYMPTFDIDNAWAFKHKSITRLALSTMKDVLNRRCNMLSIRFKVLLKLKNDPYDNYDFMLSTLNQYHFKPITFFLLGNKGKYDRAISYRNQHFRSLVLKMANNGEVGIHPSYVSNKNPKHLINEIEKLYGITNKKIVRSRQHFLKLSMPKTYRQLIENGIKIDYSMGYSTHPGFRASIATPFYFFDLLKNETTSLKVYPFQVMDVTLLNYRSMGKDDAIRKITKLMNETAKVGGTFVSLWHNETLGELGRSEGWREVYTEMTRLAANIRNGKTTETL